MSDGRIEDRTERVALSIAVSLLEDIASVCDAALAAVDDGEPEDLALHRVRALAQRGRVLGEAVK